MKTERLNTLPLPDAFAELVDGRVLMQLIDMAIHEDLGRRGDVTSAICIDETATTTARMRARKPGRLAGVGIAALIAKRYDQQVTTAPHLRDGAVVDAGGTIAAITGPLRSILAAERVMLNMVSHLSGIATLTGQYVEAIGGTPARIYDTRKTLPGYRGLAKYAVRCGGGHCHRIGLYDAVLLKDNHLTAQPDLPAAISRARALQPLPDFIEVEVDTLEQLEHVLACDVDLVLLDNMTTDQLIEAVGMRGRINPGVELEASGGVNLKTVRAIAETGVDRIAVGALTHSAPALDIGLDID